MDIDRRHRSLAERCYRTLLRLYPRSFREEAEPDLAADFRQGWAEARRAGLRETLGYGWMVLADLGRTLPLEWAPAWREPPGPIVIHAPPAHRRPGRMEMLVQDLRTAWRSLRAAPVATAVAALTIALGVGATTTIFGVGNAILLRTPPGVRQPAELVSVHRIADDGSSFHAFSYPDFRDMQRAAGVRELAAYAEFASGVGAGEEPVIQMGNLVSENYFRLLGVRPAVGRFFTAEEDPGAAGPRVAVLSHAAWQRQFNGDPGVVGRAVIINGQPFTVVGIAEPGFHGHVVAFKVDIWMPLSLHDVIRGGRFLESRRSVGLEMLARLAPGATVAQAGDALSAIFRAGAAEAQVERNHGVDLQPYSPVPAAVRLPLAGFLGVLLVLAGLVLLIASANVANVLLARASGRSREIAVRLALGAGRGRLVRQLVTETLLLFIVGGVGGAMIATWSTSALAAIDLPLPLPVVLDFSLDLRVFGIALLVTLATGLLFGLAPALQATRPGLVQSLKDEAGVVRVGRFRLRGAFVVAQVAGTTLLLVVAGLFVRALGRAGAVDLGFDPGPVHVLQFEFRSAGYDSTQVRQFVGQLESTIAARPGVERVGSIDQLPINLGNQTTGFAIEGRAPEPGVGQFQTDFATVTPGYLGAIGIPLARGRDFAPADVAGAPAVAIINETLAARAWPGEDPIGKVIRFGAFDGSGTLVTIVGVARNAKYRSIGEQEAYDMLYRPLGQVPRERMTVLVRAQAGGPTALSLRAAVRELDPNLPIAANTSYRSLLDLSLLPNRMAVLVAALFGATGLVLATVGLYGVLSYTVQRRRREIGIRMALGAAGARVRGLVLRDGMRLTLIGLLVGLAAAAAVTRLLGALLFGLDPIDPLTYAIIGLVMLATTWVACAGPVRRALRTEPLEVLRHD